MVGVGRRRVYYSLQQIYQDHICQSRVSE